MHTLPNGEPDDCHLNATEPAAFGTPEERANILMTFAETFTNAYAKITHLGESETIVKVYRSNGRMLTMDSWDVTLKATTADVAIKHDNVTEWFGPMEALTMFYRELSDRTW